MIEIDKLNLQIRFPVMKLVRQIQLHFREGNSDKVYEVDLCETDGKYLVNFKYGRRGANLKEGTKTVSPVSLAEAEKAFQKLVDEKTKKGYRVVSQQSDSKEPAKPKTVRPQNEKDRDKAVLNRIKTAVENRNENKGMVAKATDAISKVLSQTGASEWNLERVIWRAGELKIKEAAPLLVQLLGTKDDLRDYCIAWSLGWCGDEDSLQHLSKIYNDNRSPDFVRRIAGEAMLKLADEETKNFLKDRAISFLPEELREVARSGTAESFNETLHAYLQESAPQRFSVLEQLYTIDNEIVRPALLETLRTTPLKPKYFKTIRHIFKAAEYRLDAEVFGIIAKRFEIEKANYTTNSYWDTVYLKNDKGEYESVSRKAELKHANSRIAYGDKTRDYFRRRTWRTLRRLGELGDTDYVKMAVGALLAYTDKDAQPPRTTSYTTYIDPQTRRRDWRNPRTYTTYFDSFAPYLLFNHILYESSPRYELKTNTRAWRCKGNYKTGDPAPDIREEAFPKLWEKHSIGLLHLLSESVCLPVHEFAVKALRDCKDFLNQIDSEAIIMLLERPYNVTAQFGFELAKARYNPSSPDKQLILAVAICANAEARAEGFRWIDANRELFTKDGDAIITLLICAHQDTRTFATNLLRVTTYTESEAQVLIARLVANLILFDETKREQAKDISDAILKSFGQQLRRLGMSVIMDLLSHPVVEVQELGGNILLIHETPAEKLPDSVIAALIESPHEEMRGIGIKLFGQLPFDVLLERENVIFSLLAHSLEDVHNSIRPVVKRLCEQNESFAYRLTILIINALLETEKHEDVYSRLVHSLSEDVKGWTNQTTIETARKLVNAQSPAAQEAAGKLICARVEDWHKNFTTNEIVTFTDNEIKALREASWALAETSVARFLVVSNFSHHTEVSVLVRALDSRWDDSRDFWFEFFRTKLTSEDLTPDILISICDSVKEPVQKFGRDLLLTYFKEENGQEYMLKLSEHPSTNMQLFVTSYLERYAKDSNEKLNSLAPYFVRVLSSINKARTAKQRIYAFLESEAMKNEASAKLVSEILERQSATIAITDKAIAIELLLKIHRAYPAIQTPLDIRQTEVRAHAV